MSLQCEKWDKADSPCLAERAIELAQILERHCQNLRPCRYSARCLPTVNKGSRVCSIRDIITAPSRLAMTSVATAAASTSRRNSRLRCPCERSPLMLERHWSSAARALLAQQRITVVAINRSVEQRTPTGQHARRLLDKILHQQQQLLERISQSSSPCHRGSLTVSHA